MLEVGPLLEIAGDTEPLSVNAESEVDRSLFAAFVLQYFASVGYRLNGSFPFGRSGPLNFGSRKELWIFRGTLRRPESANGHRRRRPSRGAETDVRNQAQQ